jgi:hypothetical protein
MFRSKNVASTPLTGHDSTSQCRAVTVIAPGIDTHGHNGLLDPCWCRFSAFLMGCTVLTREAS